MPESSDSGSPQRPGSLPSGENDHDNETEQQQQQKFRPRKLSKTPKSPKGSISSDPLEGQNQNQQSQKLSNGSNNNSGRGRRNSRGRTKAVSLVKDQNPNLNPNPNQILNQRGRARGASHNQRGKLRNSTSSANPNENSPQQSTRSPESSPDRSRSPSPNPSPKTKSPRHSIDSKNIRPRKRRKSSQQGKTSDENESEISMEQREAIIFEPKRVPFSRKSMQEPSKYLDVNVESDNNFIEESPQILEEQPLKRSFSESPRIQKTTPKENETPLNLTTKKSSPKISFKNEELPGLPITPTSPPDSPKTSLPKTDPPKNVSTQSTQDARDENTATDDKPIKIEGDFDTESDSEVSSHAFEYPWPSTPKDLRLLDNVKTVTVRQQEDEYDSAVSVGMQLFACHNHYDVVDESDAAKERMLFHAVEVTDKKFKHKGAKRHYVIDIRNKAGTPILTLHRTPSFCGDGIEITLADGSLLGGIKAGCTCVCCASYFDVYDSSRTTLLYIEDRGWCCREFAVVKRDDKSAIVAHLCKRFFDGVQESMSDADVYLLELHGHKDIMSPVVKAILICAVLFIDFKYFEDIRIKHQTTDNKRKQSKMLSKVSSKITYKKLNKVKASDEKLERHELRNINAILNKQIDDGAQGKPMKRRFKNH